MLKIVFVAACVAAMIAAAAAGKVSEIDNLFHLWSSYHGKQYQSAEEREFRKGVFAANHEFIVSHNQKTSSYKVAHNEFSDLSNEEFRRMYLSTKVPSVSGAAYTHTYNGVELPTSVDWVAANKVVGIKNQGQCGSCWAFSATVSIESAWAIAGHPLTSLSEQQLVDCSTKFGNAGCNGGLMAQAFEYVIANKGQDTEASYPYKAVDGRCKFSATSIGATISKYANVTTMNNQALMSAVSQQPVSIAIYAAGASFQFYSEGVYDDPACLSDVSDLDHGVAVVGYGVSDNQKLYWKVRNSWGTSWGQAGYIYMLRGSSTDDHNTCGILDLPSYPIV